MGLPLVIVRFEHGICGVICMGGGSRERRSGTEGIPNQARGDEEQGAVGVMAGHKGTGKAVDRQFPLR